jgi:hypothetical protein
LIDKNLIEIDPLASEYFEPGDPHFLCLGYRPDHRADHPVVIRRRAAPIRYPGFAHLGPNLPGMANRRPDLTRCAGPCMTRGPAGLLTALVVRRASTAGRIRKPRMGRRFEHDGDGHGVLAVFEMIKLR